jgi:hypothetical protein
MRVSRGQSLFERPTLILLVLVLGASGVAADSGEAADFSLEAYNSERISITQNALYVLGGWAALNILAGAAGAAVTEGEASGFYEMTAGWNLVNLGLSGFGLLGIRDASTELSLWETTQAQNRIEDTLLFNAGLDIGYMMMGFLIRSTASESPGGLEADRLRGWGTAVVAQGAFLFAFDLVAYLRLRRHRRTLESGFPASP